jgi:hypothetical protein
MHARPSVRFLVSGALLLLLALFFACGPSPTAIASNEPNQSGGTLHVSGVLATKGGVAHVAFLNPPGRSGPISAPDVTSDGAGNYKVDFAYTYNPLSPLPGCKFASSNTGYTLNVSATDVATTGVAFTTVAIADCGWQ